MSLLKERVLNNSYKAYIKNLVGTKKEIIINDNNTIEDLKIIVIKKLYNTNVKKLLENFPYYIVYKGCRINKEYDLNTTMKELDVKDETVFYVIDDMDCKKLIEKALVKAEGSTKPTDYIDTGEVEVKTAGNSVIQVETNKEI